jgi:hypothetical protein
VAAALTRAGGVEGAKGRFRYERDVEEEGKPHRVMRLERGYAQ